MGTTDDIEWEYAIRDTASDELITDPQPNTDSLLPLLAGEALERRRKAGRWSRVGTETTDGGAMRCGKCGRRIGVYLDEVKGRYLAHRFPIALHRAVLVGGHDG